MRFSIITCTYNSAAFLKKNINSVLGQSFGDFEHIFIDAYSSDGTIKLINEYKKLFPNRVKFFQIPPKGISNAMNKGTSQASGDYLIHLHADDNFFSADVLSDVDDFLLGNNYDWIYGKINVVDDKGLEVGVFPAKKIFQNKNGWFSAWLLRFYNYIPHQAVFIKKAVFKNYGFFDESLSSGMDPDLWLRISKHTKWTFFNRVISNFQVHAEAKSSGVKFKKETENNWQVVQRRYLNGFELILASVINFLVAVKNKNYR
ncbi:MAG: hypothetical protein A3J93_01030 [Candidatus Magasanikbacteria bacterium RIFOXYC2_FULL_42_28]|uniref:Glycosyltransferase 2-like domain-containing protein n=1 Tax=Candidatus Magasanikbacteria bacterium RIFOXYC2_FULL_42_28 TaxID=1798704 RepID=A0A1F6NXK5_9BACT|nr:MAG: hypothetical protein A3J93_01030 [Candidatus Magasanikbacteria bacterium RIFOXYC2_FULL_42_28]